MGLRTGRSSPLSAWREAWAASRGDPKPVAGLGVGLGLVAVVTLALVPFQAHLSRSSPALALVVPVVLAGVFGGWVASTLTAIAGAFAFNVFFIPPVGTLRVALAADVVALVVFTVVAIAVGTLVASEAKQRRAAEHQAEQIQAMHAQFQELVAEQERLREEASRLALLEQVDQQRAALLRSVSHDLRTPLASIKAVASDLRAGAVLGDPVRNELLDLVCDEAERLDRIVANLLSMSRIEAGALQPDSQAVDLEELCGAVAHRLARLFSEVELEIQVPEDLPLVDVDYVQIDQVLTNLLENAARHSEPGSTVRVFTELVDTSVAVTVRDEGSGITPDAFSHLFEPFHSGAGSASTGLGLAICKAVVEAHGGTIRARNGASGGARVWFTLPVHHG